MQLLIKTIDRKKHKIDVNPDGNTDDIKYAIAELLDIPIVNQRLIYQGAELKETTSIANLNLNPDSFFVVLRTSRQVLPPPPLQKPEETQMIVSKENNKDPTIDNKEMYPIPLTILAMLCKAVCDGQIELINIILQVIIIIPQYLTIFLHLYIIINPSKVKEESAIINNILQLLLGTLDKQGSIKSATEYLYSMVIETPLLLSYLSNREMLIYLFNKLIYVPPEEQFIENNLSNAEVNESVHLNENDIRIIEKLTELGFPREKIIRIYLECDKKLDLTLIRLIDDN